MGKIWVYDIGEQLAVPQQDEYNKFVNTLQVGKQTRKRVLNTGEGGGVQ